MFIEGTNFYEIDLNLSLTTKLNPLTITGKIQNNN